MYSSHMRGLSGAAVGGPLLLLFLYLFWAHLVVLFGFVFLFGTIYGLVVLPAWEATPWHKRRVEREALVARQLRDLRAAEFERKHGVPMPVGYGYYSEVKPGNDRRDMRFAR